jgi:hypothetical protein
MKTFKTLLARILDAASDSEINAICADIDRAFRLEKITAADNELLYRTVNLVYTHCLPR